MSRIRHIAATAVVFCGLVGGAHAAPAKDPYAPSRLEVKAETRATSALPGDMVVMTVRVRNVGIEDLYDVRVTASTRNSSPVTKERGEARSEARGVLGDMPVGTSRAFRMRLQVTAGGHQACGTVRVTAAPAAPVAASVCVPVRTGR